MEQSNNFKQFDLRDKRLMISLGPLSPKKYCTYSCPFCYLHSDGFESYAKMSVENIIDWIKQQTTPFEIIYVSGDTDSFAPPRTDEGIKLLKALTEFDVDILFTTRTLFGSNHLEELSQIQKILNSKGKMLIGCVSITQLNHPHIEPKPIPDPLLRIEQLNKFKELNVFSVLAMRPFLPIIPLEEYLEIIRLAKDSIDLVLGSVWYADQDGILEKQVFRDSIKHDTELREQLDFYDSDATWKVYKSTFVENGVSEFCSSLNIPFFMRSKPAVEWIRQTNLNLANSNSAYKNSFA